VSGGWLASHGPGPWPRRLSAQISVAPLAQSQPPKRILAQADRAYDATTQSMLKALRYWIAVPEGQPEEIFDELLKRQTLKTIPLNHVMLMVAGNGSENTQVTQHIAARPPAGGLHSAFFQRQYKLT